MHRMEPMGNWEDVFKQTGQDFRSLYDGSISKTTSQSVGRPDALQVLAASGCHYTCSPVAGRRSGASGRPVEAIPSRAVMQDLCSADMICRCLSGSVPHRLSSARLRLLTQIAARKQARRPKLGRDAQLLPGGEPLALAVDVEASLFYAVEVRVPYRPPLSDGAQPALRLRINLQGNPPHRGRRTQEAQAGRRYRNEGLGRRSGIAFMPEPCRLGAGTVRQRRRGR